MEASVKHVYTNSYESYRKERKLLRQWEAFFEDVINGTRKLSDKPALVLSNGLHVPGASRLPLDAVDYPSKAHVVENGQKDETFAYWREMRKEVAKLNKLSLVNQWFGIPGNYICQVHFLTPLESSAYFQCSDRNVFRTSPLSREMLGSTGGSFAVRESTWGMDPANWARYSSKITHPMDLRTMSEKLEGAGTPPQYTNPEQVATDIRLVVSNCEKFNEGDSSDQVCKVARQLQNSWERRWQPDDGTGLWRRWQQMQTRHAAEKKVRCRASTCANASVSFYDLWR